MSKTSDVKKMSRRVMLSTGAGDESVTTKEMLSTGTRTMVHFFGRVKGERFSLFIGRDIDPSNRLLLSLSRRGGNQDLSIKNKFRSLARPNDSYKLYSETPTRPHARTTTHRDAGTETALTGRAGGRGSGSPTAQAGGVEGPDVGSLHGSQGRGRGEVVQSGQGFRLYRVQQRAGCGSGRLRACERCAG